MTRDTRGSKAGTDSGKYLASYTLLIAVAWASAGVPALRVIWAVTKLRGQCVNGGFVLVFETSNFPKPFLPQALRIQGHKSLRTTEATHLRTAAQGEEGVAEAKAADEVMEEESFIPSMKL